jgi:hypothetical protein
MSFRASQRVGNPSESGSAVIRPEFARRVGYAAVLLPASVATVGAVAVGRWDRTCEWWARAGEQGVATQTSSGRPGAARLLAHALLCVPLGLLALIPVGLEILFVLRGVLYPLVDRGPYNHSWGGPSVGGAWLAHFGVGVPLAVAGVGALWLLGRLHSRLAGWTWGRKVGLGPFITTAAASVGGVALVIAWIHQL